MNYNKDFYNNYITRPRYYATNILGKASRFHDNCYINVLQSSIVKQGKNGTNLTNLSIIRYLLWPSLPHFLVLIHWSLAFMNK